MAESENTTVARPYARAAFSEALEQADGLANWSKMLAGLSAIVQEPVVEDALDNPRLTRSQQAALLIEVMGDELTAHGRNFVTVLADYGRLSLLPIIAEMYELLKANHEKTMDVTLVSAFDISDSESQKLAEALKRRLQRDVNLTSTTDKSLVGGVIIRTEDTVIDHSVRGKLQKLAQVLG